MKTKILSLLVVSCLLFSCSQEEYYEADGSINSSIAQIENNYEAYLNGYAITPKESEIGPFIGEKIETSASPEFMQILKDSLELTYSKMSTKSFTPSFEGVGVFKYSTCGSYGEFHYYQDTQDKGITKVTGDIGETTVDAGKNLILKMCIVPGDEYIDAYQTNKYNYGGGVLQLSPFTNPSNGDINIIRYHDDENSSNKNSVLRRDNLSMDTYNNNRIGECYFSSNTQYCWTFRANGNRKTLGFKYGVLMNDSEASDGYIFVDDEDSSNSNWAKVYTFGNNNTVVSERYMNTDERFKGVRHNRNTEYFIKTYPN